jgi:hypothetical protein
MTTQEQKISEFLLAHGGPFYTLQQQLGLLHENAFRAGLRAVLFVSIAWGTPLLLCVAAGHAYGPQSSNPYLLDLGAWSRFFIATGLFLLTEKKVESQLRSYLRQFVRTPLLAPGAFEPAATAVSRALKRRDAKIAEFICLLIAVLLSLLMYLRLMSHETSTWAIQLAAAGNRLTLAGWWVLLVSNPIFYFLGLRWLWRLWLWGLLLRELAGLGLRLVATHPDGHGGLAFLGTYPNAFTLFVFAISCVLGAAVANELMERTLTPTVYGLIMAGWLVVILVFFAIPLLTFNKPLGKLKQQTLLALSARATQHHRAAERALLGRNITAADDAATVSSGDIPDPDKAYLAAKKLSPMLISRATLLPLAAASLLPLVAAGTTQLPLKDILTVVKRLLLL